MKAVMKATFFVAMAAAITILPLTLAAAQGQSADTMKILQEKIKTDKKLFVATNMELTEAEAKGFWPVYEQYQKDLSMINQRLAKLIQSYATDYNANTMTDEKAKKLIDEILAVEKAEAELKMSYVPKLGSVLSPKKVARYLQLENKVRALVKMDLAKEIPLVE